MAAIPSQGVAKGAMKRLPKLPADGHQRIEDAKIVARARIRRARRNLGGSGGETVASELDSYDEPDDALGDVEFDVRSAANDLFDVYAAQYWNAMQPDLRGFTNLLSQLVGVVCRDIAWPKLEYAARSIREDKLVEWTERAAEDNTEHVAPRAPASATPPSQHKRRQTENPAETAATIIDRFRIQEGWSLDQLAQKAGLDRRQVFKVRAGRNVRPYVLKALAGVMRVEPSALLPGPRNRTRKLNQ